MQRRPLGILTLGLILTALSTAVATAQDAPPAVLAVGAEPQPHPSPVRWDGNIATLGSVQVNAATKTVTATGWVNQTEGLIEVLACGTKGKVHESMFVLALNPLDLQAALLLIGLKGGEPIASIDDGPPTGDPVDLRVEWQAEGETRRARAESLIWNLQENAVLPKTPWTFNGSMIKDGEFKALAEESLIVSYWDPYAIINLPLPCGANDELLVVNTNTVPPYETPVTFVFTPQK